VCPQVHLGFPLVKGHDSSHLGVSLQIPTGCVRESSGTDMHVTELRTDKIWPLLHSNGSLCSHDGLPLLLELSMLPNRSSYLPNLSVQWNTMRFSTCKALKIQTLVFSIFSCTKTKKEITDILRDCCHAGIGRI